MFKINTHNEYCAIFLNKVFLFTSRLNWHYLVNKKALLEFTIF